MLAIGVLLCAASACNDAPSGPSISAVQPSRGALGVATAVSIVGEHFYVATHVSYDDEARSRADARFQLWLGDVALGSVKYVDTRTLSAVVPATLPLGRYRLRLVDPRGREATRDGAFTVGQPPADGGSDSGDAPPDAPDARAIDAGADTATDLGHDGGARDSTVDTTRLDTTALDSTVDAAARDSTVDTTTPDSTVDAPRDSTVDTTPRDSSVDSSVDATPPDSTVDAPRDSTVDTTPPDSTIDAAPPQDSTVDAAPPQDSTVDAPRDSTVDTTKLDTTVDQSTGPLTGTAIWRKNGFTTPYAAQFSSGGLGSIGPTVAVGEWRIIVGARSPTRDELIVVGVDKNKIVAGMIYRSSQWTALTINPLSGMPVSKSEKLGVAVAYDSSNGNAVVVWNNNDATANLRYAVWNGNTWSTKTTIGAYTGVEPQRLRLASKPGGGEMVLVISDDNADHRALVYNGSSWGNQIVLDTSGDNDDHKSSTYVAYEQVSGHALVVYGKKDDPRGFSRIWNGSAWSSELPLSAPTGVTKEPRWMTLGADPRSDRIALGVLTRSDDDVWLSMWTGSSWTPALLATATSNGDAYPAVAVAFEGASGRAIAAYNQNGSDAVRFRRWAPSTGWGFESIGPTLSNQPRSLTLSTHRGTNNVMLSALDSAKDLRFLLWTGASWIGGTPIETDTGDAETLPFLFVW